MSRKVWTRQPEIGARINHASPLSRGLVFAMPDVGSGVDAVGPRVEPSDTGTVTRVATPAGRGVSSYGGIRWIPNPNGSLKLYTGPITHAFVARLVNLDAWGGIFTVRDVSSANTCAGLTRRSSSDDLSFSRDSATELTITGAAPAVANGLMQPVVVVSTGLGASDPTYLYVGSTKYTSATGSASAPSYSAVGLVLYASRWSGAAEGVDGEYVSHFTWNRALTDAEARAFIANPWQMFAARNEPTFFLGPAAGGVTIDAGVGAATAAGLSATIASGITVAAGVGAALGAGLAGGVASGITLLSGVGAAVAAGVGAAVASPITIAVGVGAATGTGLAAGVSSAVTVAAGIGAAAAGGLQAGVSVGAAISAGTGAANAAGLAAGVSSPITVAATVGAAVGAGKAASVSAGGTVESGVGAAAAGSHPALVSSPQTITAGVGSASAAGRQSSIGSGTTIPAGIGAASALGLTATVTAATHIVAGVGVAVARGLKAGVSDATPAVLAQFGVRGASAIQRQARGRLAQVQRGRRLN